MELTYLIIGQGYPRDTMFGFLRHPYYPICLEALFRAEG